MEYKGFIIVQTYPVPPTPFRGWDYTFTHEQYDGPEDPRTGKGKSIEDCKRQINKMTE